MPGSLSTYFLLSHIFLDIILAMPTEKPKIIFVADEELFNRIDDFRFESRINSRSEAIRRLLEEALKRYEKKTKAQT